MQIWLLELTIIQRKQSINPPYASRRSRVFVWGTPTNSNFFNNKEMIKRKKGRVIQVEQRAVKC